jgi:hypothetical protein
MARSAALFHCLSGCTVESDGLNKAASQFLWITRRPTMHPLCSADDQPRVSASSHRRSKSVFGMRRKP